MTSTEEQLAHEDIPVQLDEASDQEDWVSAQEDISTYEQRAVDEDATLRASNEAHRDTGTSEANRVNEGANRSSLDRECPPETVSRWERIRQHMLASGRCPHQIEYFRKLYGWKQIEYLAKLKPLPIRGTMHGRCAEHDTCVAFNTDERNYQQRHVCDHGDCESVSVPQELLAKVIRSGKTPILSIDLEDESHPRLHISARSQGTKYIAISHVWADGLGNPTQCALPSCQVRVVRDRLSIARTSLYRDNGIKEPRGPNYFWMDTLCIPVQAEMIALRLAQIDNMASIYARAITTLVLDAELMAISTEAFIEPGPLQMTRFSLPCELRARVVCSAWMSRSWTLQEGALAPSITLQFKDNMVSMGMLPSTSKVPHYDERLATVSPAISAVQQELAPILEPLHPRDCDQNNCSLHRSLHSSLFAAERSLARVWNSLVGRTTMKSEDLPLIIANLLDLKTHQLVRYGDTIDPFAIIMRSVPEIPFSFLFNRSVVHDPQDLHRAWIPRAIGTELVGEYKWLYVHGDRLDYFQHEIGRSATDLAIYTSGAISCDTVYDYLQDPTTNTLFEFESYPTNIKTLSSTSSNDTIQLCFVLEVGYEQNLLPRCEGACFVINRRTTKSGTEALTLTFCQGLLVRRMHPTADTVMPGALLVTRITTECKLRVKFGILPRRRLTDASLSTRVAAIFRGRRTVPNIRRQNFYQFKIFVRTTLTGGAIFLAVITVVLFATVLSNARLTFLPFLFLGLTFIVGFFTSFAYDWNILRSLEEYHARRRLRSFENLARERSRRKGMA